MDRPGQGRRGSYCDHLIEGGIIHHCQRFTPGHSGGGEGRNSVGGGAGIIVAVVGVSDFVPIV